nr:MAG TPA: protein of unknown function (DUF4969) [Caudoviricetes sp.]
MVYNIYKIINKGYIFVKKRTISTILVALLVLSAFAGCNGKSEAQLELEKTQSELSESQ